MLGLGQPWESCWSQGTSGSVGLCCAPQRREWSGHPPSRALAHAAWESAHCSVLCTHVPGWDLAEASGALLPPTHQTPCRAVLGVFRGLWATAKSRSFGSHCSREARWGISMFLGLQGLPRTS